MKKKMRKNVCLPLCISALLLCGCGAKENTEEQPGITQQQMEKSTAEPAETAEATPETPAEETPAAEEVQKDYSNASLSDITNYSEIMSNFYPSGLYNRTMVKLDESDVIQPPNHNEYYRVLAPYTTLPEAIAYLRQYFSADVMKRLHEYFMVFLVSDGKLYYTFPARGFGGYDYENGVLDRVEPDGTYVVKIMYENVGSGMYEPTYHYFRENDGKFILEDVDLNGTEDEAVMIPCLSLAVVNVDHLRIRTGPGTSYPQIDEYYKEAGSGEIYPVYEVKEADGYTWYRIWNNKWISNDGTWVTLYDLD